MSTIETNLVQPSTGTTLTLGASGDTVALGTGAGVNFRSSRNMIINGAMQVSQRGTSTTTAGFIVDRIETVVSAVDELVCTYSQDSSGADGFANSYKINVDTAESAIAVDEYQRVTYKIEAQDCQGLKYGNASAESVTLSFHVKSNVTGTYAFSMVGDGGIRLIGGTYTISSSATWEKKTLTFTGDTAGIINDDVGTGLTLYFWLIAGTNFTSGSTNTSWMANTTASLAYGHAVNLGSTINNYWQVTGIQLEIGSVATPFEHKTYGQELAACQRYFQLPVNWQAYSDTTTATAFKIMHSFPVTMRASPTIGTTGTPNCVKMNVNAGGPTTISNVPTANSDGFNGGSFTIMATGAGSAAATNTPYVGKGGFTADAEL